MAKKKQPKAEAKLPNLRAKFADLPADEKRRAARAIIGGLKRIGFFGRGGYKTVHGPDQANRPRISPETEGEIGQLTISERNRLIAFARNAARNSDRLTGILHQLELNVVGVEGGKAVFSFPETHAKVGELIKREFAAWCREAEYFEDLDLNETVKKVLRTQMIGGDLVLVFDDDITSASTGQIIAFEPDCIGNLSGFEAKHPGLKQFQGIIKNANGKTVGVSVSWSQRGLSEYQEKDSDGNLSVWTLIKPEGQRWADSLFKIYRDSGRFNQIRGSSRLWPGLGTVADLSDAQGFEIQASKLGAQKIGQILTTEEEKNAEISADYDAEAPIEDVEDALKGEGEEEADEREQLDLRQIDSAGVLWDVMPLNTKMELFNTAHPNEKLVEFMTSLHGAVAFSLGLGKANATGEASSSYSASMVELMLSQIEFDDEWHKLEKGFLDWVLMRWSTWAQRRGLIPQDAALPIDWRRTCVKWSRPAKRAIDPVKEQNALASGLKNGTILYREKWGPDWREKLQAFSEELEAFRAAGVPHPADQTVAGAIIPNNTNAEPGEKEEE